MNAWVEMKDRFDFEQALLKCWEITDEIGLLNKNVLEGKIGGGNMTTDEISNFLSGLESIYDHKFDVLWNGFETVIMNIVRENKMLNEECAAMRAQLGHGAGKNFDSGAGTGGFGIKIQEPPFPPDSFTKEEAKMAVMKAKKKDKK